ncbi:MAG TPA: hypothetical protein VF795_04140 [Desulfuromonadaceae bacterium]
MRYRRFALAFAVALALFAGGNYVIWKTVTEDLITDRHYQGGDLSRMGYLPGSKFRRRNTTDLPRRHIRLEEYDGRRVDMITIGDSFSNGGGGGYNRFYQDYIATRYGFEVLNIPRHNDLSPLVSIADLARSGFLKRSGARYLLLGVSEKAWREMSGPDPLGNTMDEATRKGFKRADYGTPLPRTAFINNGNFKFLLNALLYRFSDHAVFSQVYRAQLLTPLFTAEDSRTLLYLRYRETPGPGQVARLNDNLNLLAGLLARQGITLIFMPCVDKYDLYHPYLRAPRYAPSAFFEELRPLPKHYLFVDTKMILNDLLLRGEKDVYYPDDTHWSWKASLALAGSMPLGRYATGGSAP